MRPYVRTSPRESHMVKGKKEQGLGAPTFDPNGHLWALWLALNPCPVDRELYMGMAKPSSQCATHTRNSTHKIGIPFTARHHLVKRTSTLFYPLVIRSPQASSIVLETQITVLAEHTARALNQTHHALHFLMEKVDR